MADKRIEFPRKRVPTRPMSTLYAPILLLVWVALGLVLWQNPPGGDIFVFAFVLAGWILSLGLHEFAHALAGTFGGDKRMAGAGELALDPTRYGNVLLSLIFPTVFFLFGGIGLPGPLEINPARLRGRGWQIAVAAAGPAMNLLLFLALLALYQAIPPGDLRQGLASLAYLQVTAIVLNLLPVPGLDGFAAVRPFLPIDIAVLGDRMGAGAIFLLFALIWWWRTGVAASLIKVATDFVRGIDPSDIVTYGVPLGLS